MTAVEIKVGVVDTPREITVESDETAEAITKAVSSAIDKGTLLSLTDSRGRTVLVPSAKIAYVEIGPGFTPLACNASSIASTIDFT